MAKEVLFWVHVGVGLVGASVGFYLSLPIVLGLIVVHRLHLLVFRGCAISRFQQYLGHFPEQVNFLQVVAKKILKRDINSFQVILADYTLVIIPISAAAIRFIIS